MHNSHVVVKVSHILKDGETKNRQLRRARQIFKCARLWMADALLFNPGKDGGLMLWHVLFGVRRLFVGGLEYWNGLWPQGGLSLLGIIQITLSNPLIGIKHEKSSAEGQRERSSRFSARSWLAGVCSVDLHGKHPPSLILSRPALGTPRYTGLMKSKLNSLTGQNICLKTKTKQKRKCH